MNKVVWFFLRKNCCRAVARYQNPCANVFNPALSLAVHRVTGHSDNGEMLRIVGCVLNQHDYRLFALTAFICVLSCLTASALLSRARVADRWLRVTWLAIAGLEFGGGVWSLHFIAMLGFMPGLAISYDVGETGWSIVIAVLGAFVGFAVALSGLPVMVRVVAGAAMLTASIGGMHYVGVAAMRLQGNFTLDRGQVGLSLLASGLFGAASVLVMSDLRSLRRQSLLMLLLSLSICLLHFTGMSAMLLHLGGGGGSQTGLLGSQTLAAAVGSISVALLLISLSLSIMDRHLSDRSTLEEQRLRKIPHHDALTGLANRLLLDIELTRALQRARQQDSGAAVLCLDLDRFKFVNDLLGHPAGDRLLVAVSERLTSLVRRSDVVARVGGDEFAILLPDVTDPVACMALARLIAVSVAEPVIYEDQQMVSACRSASPCIRRTARRRTSFCAAPTSLCTGPRRTGAGRHACSRPGWTRRFSIDACSSGICGPPSAARGWRSITSPSSIANTAK